MVARLVLSLVLPLLSAFTSGGTAGAEAEPGGEPRLAAQRSLPLEFDSEIVRLFVEKDSLEVEGIYRFLCHPRPTRRVTLVYPYPADSLMGEAHTTLLECRTPGEPWQPLVFQELPPLQGVRWRIPLAPGDTLEVRTVYRQALLSTYARYIVTTTASWGRPLSHARFEIYLPEGADPLTFSYAFEPQEARGRCFYAYEARHFMPDRDIIVEWTH